MTEIYTIAAEHSLHLKNAVLPKIKLEEAQAGLDALLKEKELSIAAAFNARQLVTDFTSVLPHLFRFAVNCGSADIMEKVFEVPRVHLNCDDGVNSYSAMYIAHFAAEIFHTEVGLSILMLPDNSSAFMGLRIGGRLMAEHIVFPGQITLEQRVELAGEYFIRYMKRKLTQDIESLPDTLSVQELLGSGDDRSLIVSLLLKLKKKKRTN